MDFASGHIIPLGLPAVRMPSLQDPLVHKGMAQLPESGCKEAIRGADDFTEKPALVPTGGEFFDFKTSDGRI